MFNNMSEWIYEHYMIDTETTIMIDECFSALCSFVSRIDVKMETCILEKCCEPSHPFISRWNDVNGWPPAYQALSGVLVVPLKS